MHFKLYFFLVFLKYSKIIKIVSMQRIEYYVGTSIIFL